MNKNKKIKLVFIGTAHFALPSLAALAKEKSFSLEAVITQPDKKAGRQQTLTPPPVKLAAAAMGLKIWQPEKISLVQEKIKHLKPDLIVVAAYAQILPPALLSLPICGCINIHGSLLPRWRGAAGVQAAILAGDRESGVTIMKMDEHLDTGPLLAQKRVKIAPEETAASLYEKLAQSGGEIIVPVLKKYLAGKIKPRPQDEKGATYAGRIKKEDGRINWTKPAGEIERFVRAMSPWPGAYAKMKDGRILKILEAENKILGTEKFKTGEIFLAGKKLAVQGGQGALIIKKLQLAGKKSMNSEEFLRGQPKIVGQILE